MSSESPAAAAPKTQVEPASTLAADRLPRRGLAILADAGLVLLFLALTFLLGVFPLKDTDIFWHLRTGQIIRETGQVPHADFFTYTREGVPWIDLHWIFQVAVSWIYERGGAVAMNLAKCIVTCLAVLILLTNRRREWPIWVAILAWLPALLVLGGRIYVRPETLSLLYLSIFLAVLTRWDRHPYLVAILPIVEVFWVNSHGLFVLGPIVLTMALLDAALRPWRLAIGPRRWWRIAGAGALSTFAACLVNPYGIWGAVYPIELAGTMTNPVFSHHIAELTPIPMFIEQAGLGNLPLQLHFLTMGLGALSFLVPLLWSIGVRFRGAAPDALPEPSPAGGRARKKADAQSKPSKKKAGRSRVEVAPKPEPARWRLSPFRLLLFAAFSYLSLQATRNSHQFAAVVGSVTAWNLAEWAAAIRARRIALSGDQAAAETTRSMLAPRLVAALAVVGVLTWVGSGAFYRMAGEGRTIRLGEEPVFFAHDAARFCGRPEMPPKFLSFHNGHASLFEFYNGPERKVFTDPRLEVAGAALFQEFVDLNNAVKTNERGWPEALNRAGRPTVMIDHEHNWDSEASMFASAHWRCVWFDPIVGVFVHDSAEDAVRDHGVDFATRHFRPDTAARVRTPAERASLAKVFRSLVGRISSHRTELIRPMVWNGLDACRALLVDDPDSVVAWKMMGQTLLDREPAPAPPPSPRYRLPFDPVADLSIVRATCAMRRTLDIDPDDLTTLFRLEDAYSRRAMNEEALRTIDRLLPVAASHPNPAVSMVLEQIQTKRETYLRALGEPVPAEWRNMAELDRVVTSLLAAGAARRAAEILERAHPPDRASWDVLDRIATLRLHLGEPAEARALWHRGLREAPDPAIATARIAVTHLAEADFESARRNYRRALGSKPDLFEACYGLAVLEQDAGDATAAHEMATRAVAAAPDDRSRQAAATIARDVERFATGTRQGGNAPPAMASPR